MATPSRNIEPPLLTVALLVTLPSAVAVRTHRLPPLTMTSPGNVLFPARLTSPAPSLVSPELELPSTLALIVKSGEKKCPELMKLFVPLHRFKLPVMEDAAVVLE